MVVFIVKFIVGVVLSVSACTIAAWSTATWPLLILACLWAMGLVWATPAMFRWVIKALKPASEVSIITFTSFGSGFLGLFVILVMILCFVLAGWIYGDYLLVTDIIHLVKPDLDEEREDAGDTGDGGGTGDNGKAL